ncbi:hypothetical protein FOF52_00605 [Thermobifida alba]|uniref:Permease n=1 Tax=Thermobifida alba TaxID=53522 RepID=A0ABY4KW53_THEAE|nr:hypothetical protein [Thermobifida alba]UPT19654.1 hypothetical protein FOF52_00605 [Thermobifida alba]
MPNRTLSFAYTACAAFAALLAFLLAATAEQTMFVLEDSEMVWITENEGTHDIDAVARTVQQVADDHGAAVGYAVLDVHEPSSLAHLYLAVSDPDSHYARWLRDGYPAFGRGFTVQTHPITEFGEVGPNGYYFILGASDVRPVLRDALAAHGLHEAPGTQVTELWHYFTGGPLFNLLAVALLATVAAVGAGVLLSARDYAVMRLQGHSYPGILLADLAKIARLWAVALPAVAAATLVFLGVYNGWNQLGRYTPLALVFLTVLTLPCLAAHAAVLGLVHTTGILPALKGRLPVRSTTAAVYLVRVPVLVLTLTILGSVVLSAQQARDQRVGLELYEQYGDASRPALSANYGWSDEQAVDDTLGPWLRRVDADGDMVLAVHSSLEFFLPAAPGNPAPSDGDTSVLVVNDTYLTEQEVLAPSGERHGPGETVRVIVPESVSVPTDQLVEGTNRWLALYGAPDTFDVEVLTAAAGQTLFTYGAQRPEGSRFLPLLHEPVLVVLPNGQVLSDNAYVTHMSGRSTVFPDPEVVEAFRAENPQASRYISMVETLTTSARQEHAATLTVLRSELFSLAGAGAVLLLTAAAACIVYVRTRAQTIFARHISGWTFLATHRRLLAAEAAVAVGFVGWATWDTLTALAARNDPTRALIPGTEATGAEPFYALGIAAASLAITVAALALFHRRIVREGTSQA